MYHNTIIHFDEMLCFIIINIVVIAVHGYCSGYIILLRPIHFVTYEATMSHNILFGLSQLHKSTVSPSRNENQSEVNVSCGYQIASLYRALQYLYIYHCKNRRVYSLAHLRLPELHSYNVSRCSSWPSIIMESYDNLAQRHEGEWH